MIRALLVAALAAALPVFACALAPLRAGFAVEDITPDLGPTAPLWLAGFRQGRSATAVHDKLYARCVVFASFASKERAVALVSVDLIGYFRDEVDRIRAKLKADGVPVDEVLVSSTHTHSGPDTIGIWGASNRSSGVDPAYLQRVVDRVTRAIRAAHAGLAAVKLYGASGRTKGLTRDFRLPEILDEELGIVQARIGKKTAFTLVNWSSHPEALGRRNREVSADYCASLVASVEKGTGAPAAFFNGTIGGLMTPLEVPMVDPRTKRPAPPESFRHAALIGEAVASDALKLARRAKPFACGDLKVVRRDVDIPMSNPLYRAGVTLGVIRRSLYKGGQPLAPMFAAMSAPDVRTEVAIWRIGDLELAAVPGELYPELSLGKFQEPRLKEADFPDAPREPGVRALLNGPLKWVVGLANDEIGYIIPKSQWDESQPFCYGRQKPQYGEVNSLGAETAPRLAAALKACADEARK